MVENLTFKSVDDTYITVQVNIESTCSRIIIEPRDLGAIILRKLGHETLSYGEEQIIEILKRSYSDSDLHDLVFYKLQEIQPNKIKPCYDKCHIGVNGRVTIHTMGKHNFNIELSEEDIENYWK